MNIPIGILAALAILAVTIYAMTTGIPAIHAWEKANDYPYGKLCEVYRSCDR